jgi:exodeoxyribonuclease VII large subunit
MLAARADEVDTLRERALRTTRHRLDRATDEIAHHRARARALSPLATLRRGYAVLQDSDGHVLSSVADAAKGDVVMVRLADGRVHAEVTDTENLQTPNGEPDA